MKKFFPRTAVLAQYFLPADGGSINWLANVYSRLEPGTVMVVAPQCPDQQETDRKLSFPVLRIPMVFPDWDPTNPTIGYRYGRLIWQLQQIARRERLDQIHCAKVLPEGLAAWWIQRFWGIRYLLYAHGEEITTALTSRLYTWLIPKIYNDSAAIIANSSHTKHLLEKIGVRPELIRVIHPGVEASTLAVSAARVPDVRTRHGIEKGPMLLTIGRLQRRKGQDMVIKALPELRRSFPGIRYVIVGKGEEEPYLRTLAKEEGVETHTVFAGRISPADLPGYYKACDIFVMPNRQIEGDIEGFGMVFLEAGAAEKPVIGGRSGGTADAILEGTTGLRVNGESPAAIAEAILFLLTNPDQAVAMGKRGQERVEREFTWAQTTEMTRQVALDIAARGHRGDER